MRKPSSPLGFDAILAALAVLSTTTACSKAERAAAEPATATPAATMTANPSASAAPPLAAQPAPPPPSPAPTTVPATDDKTAIVDAGTERKPAHAPAKPTKGASAACGATGCSAEMRKGGK